MVASGVFPKIDGDVLYAQDFNLTTRLIALNNIQERLGLVYQQTTPDLIGNIIGSTNAALQSSRMLFTVSGNNNAPFLNAIDPFTVTPLGSIWWSGATAWTGDQSLGITTGGGSLLFQANFPAGHAPVNGSLVTSGHNLFNSFGGNVRVQIGSTGGTTAAGTSIAQYKLGNTIVYENTTVNTVVRSGTIDLMRTDSGLFWHRYQISGGNFRDWTSGAVGNGYLTIYVEGDPLTNAGVVFGTVLSINALSGVVLSSFTISGVAPTNALGSASFNSAIGAGSWFGNYTSGGATHEYSLNDGTNYNNGSLTNFVAVTTGGSNFRYRYTGSQTYASGQDGGFAVVALGFEFI